MLVPGHEVRNEANRVNIRELRQSILYCGPRDK